MKNKKFALQKGFALTEVLLSIAVIIIIGVASYPLYKEASTSNKVEDMANQIAILQTNVHTLYAGQSSYAGISIDQLNTSGLVPEALKTYFNNGASTTTFYKNVWGGNIMITSSVAGMGMPANSAFAISLWDVPQDACVKLANRVAPAFMSIRGAGPLVVKNVNEKVDIDALNTACSNKPQVAISFVSQ